MLRHRPRTFYVGTTFLISFKLIPAPNYRSLNLDSRDRVGRVKNLSVSRTLKRFAFPPVARRAFPVVRSRKREESCVPSLAVACAVLLSLRGAAPEEAREDAEDGASCVADAAGDAELSVLSGENATGHWLAKVRFLHAAGAAGEGASLRPVHLQLQRSAYTRRGGGRTVALEATLAGSPTARPDAAVSGVLDSGFKVFPERKTSCASPPPCPACPSPCPVPCGACPSTPACPELPPCPSMCPLPCPACPACPACPSPPACPPCPAPPPPPRRIPPGYVRKEGLGYYKYHTVPVTWFEAKATCEREGAHLVILNSKAEAEMVVNFFKELRLPDYVAYGIRIGLHDLIREGSFLTVLGQPITATGFADWSPGEPNNAISGEHCVTLHDDARIYDVTCDWRGTFVCELPN